MTTTKICTPCEEEMSALLSSLPSKWRDQIVAALCKTRSDKDTTLCDDVKDCETLTSLSNFTTSGSSASIQYKDEKAVTVTRTLDISTILNNLMNTIAPGCLATVGEWTAMTYTQKFQAWIDAQCECCSSMITAALTTTSYDPTGTNTSIEILLGCDAIGYLFNGTFLINAVAPGTLSGALSEIATFLNTALGNNPLGNPGFSSDTTHIYFSELIPWFMGDAPYIVPCDPLIFSIRVFND